MRDRVAFDDARTELPPTMSGTGPSGMSWDDLDTDGHHDSASLQASLTASVA